MAAMSLLRPDDYFVTSYRDHGYALARGTDPRPLMAELCGKIGGISRGKGGSMHFYDVPTGNFGGDGIVGGHLPVAAGMGYAIRLRQTDQVVLCFFGDGAVNEGAFHEALNVSALWGLPVVYIIENNRYGMGTSLDRASSVKDLYQRGSAYGIPRRDVDGMDLLTVREALGEAIDRARKEKRPTLLEVETYRYRGHSMSDPGKYRTQGRGRGDDAPRPDPAVREGPEGAAQGRRGRPRGDGQGRPGPGRRGGPLRGAEPVAGARDALRGRLRALALHPPQGRGQGPGLARVRGGGPRARGASRRGPRRPPRPRWRAEHGRHHDARGPQPGHEGGDAARPVRVPPRRGGRPVPGRLQDHPGDAPGVRRVARARHADRRGGDRRHRGRAPPSSACGRSPR